MGETGASRLPGCRGTAFVARRGPGGETPRVFPAADSHPPPASGAPKRFTGSLASPPPPSPQGPQPPPPSLSLLRPCLADSGPRAPVRIASLRARCGSSSVSAAARRQSTALRAGEGCPTPRPHGPARTCAPERAPGPGRPSWPPGPRRPRTGPGARRRPRPSTRPPGAPFPRSARRPRGQPGVAPPPLHAVARRVPRPRTGVWGPARRGRSGAGGAHASPRLPASRAALACRTHPPRHVRHRRRRGRGMPGPP